MRSSKAPTQCCVLSFVCVCDEDDDGNNDTSAVIRVSPFLFSLLLLANPYSCKTDSSIQSLSFHLHLLPHRSCNKVCARTCGEGDTNRHARRLSLTSSPIGISVVLLVRILSRSSASRSCISLSSSSSSSSSLLCAS